MNPAQEKERPSDDRSDTTIVQVKYDEDLAFILNAWKQGMEKCK